MGTRSTVKFYEAYNDKPECLASVYHQYDGYPSGVGMELAEFLKSKTIVNGFSLDMEKSTEYANGAGCLAAQYIKEVKSRVGGVYMVPEYDKEEYNYKVLVKGPEMNIVVEEEDNTELFRGTLEDFIAFCEED